jgi:topoisomerase-4 subunit B
MKPDTRRLLPVALGEVDLAQTRSTMTMLMGRTEAQSRRTWIEEHGDEVEADV